MNSPTPPAWAEGVLKIVVSPQDRLTVSGDLLEEYRERIHPARGQRAADAWYIRQVAGFVWRGYGGWAALLSGAWVARGALDWLVPTTDFQARSTVSTFVGVGIFLSAGFWRTLRCRVEGDFGDAYVVGAIAGTITALIAAFVSVSCSAIFLAVWHDPATLAAIDGSGGLAEAFALPFFLAIPGTLLGALGGLLGFTVRRLRHT
jgi:hypothetical protein